VRSNVPRTWRTPPTFDILGIPQPPPANSRPILIPGRVYPPIQSDHAYVHATICLILGHLSPPWLINEIFALDIQEGSRCQDTETTWRGVLARVRKWEVNTNVPTIYPSPLTPQNHYIPFTCTRGSLRPWETSGITRGTCTVQRLVSKALAEEKSRLQTWRLLIDNHSLRPPACSTLTPQSSRPFEQPLLLVPIVDPVFEVAAPAIYVEWWFMGAIHKKR